jgi:hypothetical protein
MVFKECLICFDTIENDYFSCADTKCDCCTCLDCTEALIDYSFNNNSLPACPSLKCKSHYILSGLKGLSKEGIKKYKNVCFEYFMKDKSDDAQKEIEQKKMIEKLRKDRQKFIKNEFPASIALVAKLTFESKLKKIEKEKKKVINENLIKAKRKCMNAICNGFLDENLVCMTCDISFCKCCEKKLNQNHICKKEDIESLNLLKTISKCPGCNFPVFKDQGCDSITCANCNTQFLYSTGEKGGHGSSNPQINIIEHKKLSSLYENKIPKRLLHKFLLIESKQPNLISNNLFISPIKKFLLTNDKNTASNELSKLLDTFYINKYKLRDYNNYMSYIEDCIKEENINYYNLEKVINKIIVSF